MFLGTPEPQYQNDPVIKPDVDKAQPLATESTLKGIRDGLSIMQSDLVSLNHKLKIGGPIQSALTNIADILETSAIARKSNSPLETSLMNLRDSTVSFNEKTERWHDDQTNLMVKGTDPRVAEAMKPERKTEDEMTTEASIGLPFISSQLKSIQETLWRSQSMLFGMHGALVGTAEDEVEDDATAKKGAAEEKKQTGFLQGMWNNMKEKAKKSWFAENWKMIAAGLLIILAPLKWLHKLWDIMKGIFDFFMGKKVTQKEVDAKKEKTEKDFAKYEKDFPELAKGPAYEAKKKAAFEEIDAMQKLADSGERVGGLFGKGGPLDGFGIEIALATAALVLFGPAVLGIVGGLIAGFKMIKGGIGMVSGAFKGVKNFAKSFTRVKDPGKAHAQALKESKVAGKAGETGAKKTAEKVGTKAVTKTATKGTGKAVGKGLGKSLLKKIPGIGLLFGAGFAVSKAMAGDFTGAGMELASGAMSIVPGVGTAGSVAMDAAIMARDMGAMKSKEKEGKQLGDDLNKAYKEGETKATVDKQESDKATKIETTKTKGITPMGPTESLTEKTTAGKQIRPKETAKKAVDKWRKHGNNRKMKMLLEGDNAKEVWNLLKDNEKKWSWIAQRKPEGATDIAIKTPPRGDFKTKIPQVGVPEKKEPTEGEPSKWLLFGHDKSAFKKQTSFGDRFKNLAKLLWGDKKADEKKGAEPATSEDQKSVDMAVARWLKRRKVKGKKNLADRGMKTYIKGIITDKNTAKLELLEKELKSLGGRWLKRSGLEAAKDSYVEAEGVTGLRKKGMGADSSIAEAWSGEEGAMKVAKERFPDIKFTAREDPDNKSKFMNNLEEKNRTLQDGKSGSVNFSSINNSNSVRNSGGDLVATIPSTVHAQKIRESNNDPVF